MKTNTKETYGQMKQRHQEEFDEFPMEFAFSSEQLQEALRELGATEDECMIIDGGGVIRKADVAALEALVLRLDDELETAMLDDGFLIGAIKYELDNHECFYGGSVRDALDALGIEEPDEQQRRCYDAAVSLTYAVMGRA